MKPFGVFFLLACLFCFRAPAGQDEPLQELTATNCEQDMTCERGTVDPKLFEWVKASTTLKGPKKDPKRYAPANAVDYSDKTAWCEGTKKSGLGQRLVIQLKKPATIDGLLVSPMYAKSIKVAMDNNRITSYIIDTGTSAYRVKSGPFTDNPCLGMPKPCPELNAPQQVRFPKVTTQAITLTIEKVERGKKYDDTCISTLRLLKPEDH